MNLLPESATPPWLLPRPKPPISSYGLLENGKIESSSLKLLTERLIADTEKKITLVWTPESDYWQAPEEITELRPALSIRAGATEISRRKLLIEWLWPAILAVIGAWVNGWGIGGAVMTGLCFIMISYRLTDQWARELVGTEDADWRERSLDSYFRGWVSIQRPIWTWGLLASIGLAAFGQIWLSGRVSIEAAGLVKPAVFAGEYWRVVTGAMLHGSVTHLWFNALALYSIGRQIEAALPRIPIVAFFFATAVGGSIASIVAQPDVTSIGASGGILGLVGLLLVIYWRFRGFLARSRQNDLLRMLLSLAAFGVLAFPVIDNGAHAGGLLVGILLGRIALGVFQADRQIASSHLSAVSVIEGVLLGGVTGLTLFALYTYSAGYPWMFDYALCQRVILPEISQHRLADVSPEAFRITLPKDYSGGQKVGFLDRDSYPSQLVMQIDARGRVLYASNPVYPQFRWRTAAGCLTLSARRVNGAAQAEQEEYWYVDEGKSIVVFAANAKQRLAEPLPETPMEIYYLQNLSTKEFIESRAHAQP